MDERLRKVERDHDRLLRDINAKFEELLDRITGAETAADTRMTLFEAKIDATVAATMNRLAANVNVLVSHILRVDARVDRQDRRITRLEYPEGESEQD